MAKIRTVDRYGIYNRPDHIGEINSGDQITDPGGYVDQNRRVLEFIAAGQRLKESRREMYDVQEGTDPDFNLMDPTRQAAYDHTDAAIDAAIVGDRLEEQRKHKGKAQSPDPTVGDKNDPTPTGNGAGTDPTSSEKDDGSGTGSKK